MVGQLKAYRSIGLTDAPILIPPLHKKKHGRVKLTSQTQDWTEGGRNIVMYLSASGSGNSPRILSLGSGVKGKPIWTCRNCTTCSQKPWRAMQVHHKWNSLLIFTLFFFYNPSCRPTPPSLIVLFYHFLSSSHYAFFSHTYCFHGNVYFTLDRISLIFSLTSSVFILD